MAGGQGASLRGPVGSLYQAFPPGSLRCDFYPAYSSFTKPQNTGDVGRRVGAAMTEEAEFGIFPECLCISKLTPLPRFLKVMRRDEGGLSVGFHFLESSPRDGILLGHRDPKISKITLHPCGEDF